MNKTYIYCLNCSAVKEKNACEHSQSTRFQEAPAAHVFEPYYDRTLRSVICSEKDREKKMRKFKNYSHPEGLYNVRDDKKFMKEMAYIQKHREEYKAQTHPGYKARTQREIEKQGERSYDQNRPDRDSFKRRIYSYSR